MSQAFSRSIGLCSGRTRMCFVGIMAENVGSKGFEVLPDVPEEQPPPQQQQRRTIVNDIALPGFRFHPTEEELVDFYLRRMVQGKRNDVELIASLDLYQYDPWELPAMAFMGEKEWLFFCPRDKKYPNGARPNRVTPSGYWKATGTDRAVRCTADFRCIGLKKTLVFYTGRAPRGNKTDWLMNEYRMPNPFDESNPITSESASESAAICSITNLIMKNSVALCRIYRKSSSGSRAEMYMKYAAREGLARSSSSNQHLVSAVENSLQASTQRFIRNCGQRHLVDFPAQILQVGSVLTPAPAAAAAAAAAALSSSSPSYHHQVPPLQTANNLLSSHAVMAWLLEETCYYDGRNGPSIISSGDSTRSTQEEQRHPHNAIGMGASKSEVYMPNNSKTSVNIDSSKEDRTFVQSQGTVADGLFQHLRHHVQHLDAGPPGDLLKNITAGPPAAKLNGAKCTLKGCRRIETTPNESSEVGLAEDLHKLEVQRDELQSFTKIHQIHHNNNCKIEAQSGLLLPNIAEYWGHGDQSSPSSNKSQQTSSSVRLEVDAFSSLTFPNLGS